MAYISCKNLSVGYEGKVVAENINFQVKQGDYLCIVGENGAGKSTLVKTVLGLLNRIDGVIEKGDGLDLKEIGYLPQQTAVQKDFPASVWEIVLSGTLPRCGNRPFYSKVEKNIAKENLRKMGIEHLKKKCYRNLSGGQQQRVLLARALCATSKLILLDEPTNGLDPKATLEFYKLIQSINKEGTAVIMVSHDINATKEYGTHILRINKNDSFFGTKEAFNKKYDLERCQCREKGGDINA